VQTFGYALFLMNDKASKQLDESAGWELGVGPTLVVVDKGTAAALTTTTARSDVYAFFFDQQGLMAGIGIQGTKITRIHPE
jgi:lipid-binding SYLF domain-containing protein